MIEVREHKQDFVLPNWAPCDYSTTGQFIEVNANCILKVARFLMTRMNEPDLQQFRAHVSECCECQEYIGLISKVMARRDQILKQLDLGGFR